MAKKRSSGEGVNPLMGKPEKEIHRVILESNIKVANIFASLVTSTLGPVGAHKVIIDEDNFIIVTRDGRTILQNTHVDHPIEGIMLELAKSQDEETGDGTTSAVILASSLLNNAAMLLSQGLHPITIIEGYILAARESIKEIEKLAVSISDIGDDSSEKERNTLKQVAKTALNNKHIAPYKDFFADIVVEAVLRTTMGYVDADVKVDNADANNIHLERVQGKGIADSELFDGMIVETKVVMPNMATRLKNCKMALFDAELSVDARTPKEISIEVNLKDVEEIESTKYSFSLLQNTINHIVSTGANVLMNHKGVDSFAMHYLAETGMMVLRNIKRGDMKKVARLTNATIVSDPASLSLHDLGHADEVEERKIGDFYFVAIHQKNARVVTLLLRGGTKQVVDEVYRTINDAVHTTVNAYHNFVLPGGGATEVEVAQRLRKYGFRDKTKRQLAIFAFAQSLEGITKILAQNSGLDALSVLLELRSEHSKSKGKKYYGLDVITGEVGDMMERGIIEPLKTKKQIIEGAMETALLILRADDYIPKKGLLGVEEELIKADIAEAIAAGKAREDVEHIYREAVKMFGREHVRDAIKLHGWDDVKKITGILTGKES